MRGQHPYRLAAALFVLAIFAGACTTATSPDPAETSSAAGTDAGATTTTTTAPESADPGGTTATTAPPTVTASAGLDQAVVDRLTEQIIELIGATEQVRGLPFLTQPNVAIVTPQELADRVREDLEAELDSDELAVDTRFMQLVGLLEPGVDLEALLVDLYSEQVAGFYDGDTGEMVIGGEAADLTPLTKSIIVHELVHALTDQHFIFNDDYEAMFDEQRYDEGVAFQSLIEGDATYFQLVYIEQLSLLDQFALATEALEQMNQTSVLQSAPAWIQDDLAFPYDTGQLFVEALVADGGIAAVDAAYTDRPASTEVVMHPSRFGGGEGILAVEPISIELDGFEVHETASNGEWGFRLLLSNSPPGVAAQAANGWGGDSYQILYDADDIVFAVAYKGDTEQDAFELADALIALATETLAMGEGVGEGGGVVFAPEDGRYAYLDRIGDGFVFILSTDAAAGAAARDQIRIP
jgi:hypothetical protein